MIKNIKKKQKYNNKNGKNGIWKKKERKLLKI